MALLRAVQVLAARSGWRGARVLPFSRARLLWFTACQRDDACGCGQSSVLRRGLRRGQGRVNARGARTCRLGATQHDATQCSREKLASNLRVDSAETCRAGEPLPARPSGCPVGQSVGPTSSMCRPPRRMPCSALKLPGGTPSESALLQLQSAMLTSHGKPEGRQGMDSMTVIQAVNANPHRAVGSRAKCGGPMCQTTSNWPNNQQLIRRPTPRQARPRIMIGGRVRTHPLYWDRMHMRMYAET
eukprot:354988-Chlamydomonas_euryale.AAC.6